MNKKTKNTGNRIAMLAVAALVAACGGGGSDAPGTGVGAGIGGAVGSGGGGIFPPPPAVSTIVTVVSPANYAGGTDQRGAYDYLNAQRQACGFGLLQQDTRLDTAAQAHSDYMQANGMSLGHTENPILPGFTGITQANRLTAVGYPYTTAGEVIAAVDTQYGSGSFGQANIMELFTAPYHGMGMLRSNRDIGVGAAVTGGFSTYHIMTVNMGTTSATPSQLLGGNDIVTYPCSGTTGVLSKTYADESPRPIPGRNLQTTPIGHPIYLKVRDGQTLVITSADLREFGAGSSETLLPLRRANDSNGQFADDSEIIYMPNAPLKTNTNYRFQATGTNNGQAVTIDFTFMTGAF